MRTMTSEDGRQLSSGDLKKISSVSCIYVSKVKVVGHSMTLVNSLGFMALDVDPNKSGV